MKVGRVSLLVLLMSCLVGGLIVTGCTKKRIEHEQDNDSTKAPAPTSLVDSYAPMEKVDTSTIDDKYRTYYEIFLASFYDSNGDGIGDINGLISKLDYLNDNDPITDTDLSVTGIWLMPIMPSDTYHKYDVNDYYSIDPSYGTIPEFKNLLEECHKRNINVIIDFVFNHTSDTNPWFQEAITYYQSLKKGEEPDETVCPYAGYYHFTKEGNRQGYYKIPDSEWYYEGKFWSGMPDLNLDNKKVREEIEKIAAYWIYLGVDGFRLDAAKEYYSGSQAKNIEVLSWFSNFVKHKDPNLYCVAEVWDTFGTIAAYYKSGIDSIFNYVVGNEGGLIATTVANGSRDKVGSKLASNLKKMQDIYKKNNENFIDATFLSNHDNNRASSYVGYDEDRIKLMGGINLMMSGCSFIYYGEELGMSGGGKDENKRAPMPWSQTKKEGMTLGPSGMTDVTQKFGPEEIQTSDAHSILNYYRRGIRLRAQIPEIARGEITVIDGLPKEVAGIYKTYQGNRIGLFINTSDKEQVMTLELDELVNSLTVNETQVEFSHRTLTLPPYAIAILK